MQSSAGASCSATSPAIWGICFADLLTTSVFNSCAILGQNFLTQLDILACIGSRQEKEVLRWPPLGWSLTVVLGMVLLSPGPKALANLPPPPPTPIKAQLIALVAVFSGSNNSSSTGASSYARESNSSASRPRCFQFLVIHFLESFYVPPIPLDK